MAGNDSAALVVALSAQLTRFESDMKSAVDIATRHTQEIENTFTRVNGAINTKLQLLSSSALNNIGFVGQLLSALGPAGFAAAVGIGVVVGGVLALANATEEYATKAKALKDAAETAGLTITQFKLLGEAGKTVGLSFDETAQFFTHFLTNLAQLRNGTGTLYDALLKVDIGLLRQLSTTKDSATAIGLLVAAYARLTDQTAKLELARAAGGRGGASGGRILETVGNQGGLPGLQSNAPVIDEAQLTRAAQLLTDIQAIRAATANVWGGMFSDAILQHQKDAAENLRDISQWIDRIIAKPLQQLFSPDAPTATINQFKELTDKETSLKQQIEAFKNLAESPGTAFLGYKQRAEELGRELALVIAQIDQIKGAATLALGNHPAASGQTPGSSEGARSNPPPPAAAGASPQVELATLQRNLALLGEAVKQSEELQKKKFEIAAAAEKGALMDGIADRALAAFNLTQRAAALAARERIGVATEQEIVDVKLAQLQQDKIKFGLTENEVQTATVVIMREAKQAADALTVRQSYLPGLKQLEIDAGSLRKGLDELSVSGLNSVTDELANLVTGTKTASAAFRDMANSILQDIARMVIRQTLIAPLAGALQGGLGSLFGGAGGAVPIPLTGVGGIGHAAGGGSFGAGSVVDVGERGPERVIFGQPGMVVPNDVVRSGGGAVNVTYSPSITVTGAQAVTPDQLAVVLASERAQFQSRTIAAITDARRRSVKV